MPQPGIELTSVELHCDPGPFEGRSTNWATAPRHPGKKLLPHSWSKMTWARDRSRRRKRTKILGSRKSCLGRDSESEWGAGIGIGIGFEEVVSKNFRPAWLLIQVAKTPLTHLRCITTNCLIKAHICHSNNVGRTHRLQCFLPNWLKFQSSKQVERLAN